MDNEAATTTSLISASVPASAAKADDEKSIEKPKAEGSGDPSTDGELIVSRVAETIEPASGQSDSSAEQQMPSSEADKENELNMYQVRLQICRSDLYFSPYIKFSKIVVIMILLPLSGRELSRMKELIMLAFCKVTSSLATPQGICSISCCSPIMVGLLPFF